ncbi:MAG TPA: hypothetical protein VGK59_09165 [Ohtaekwangia sp.]
MKFFNLVLLASFSLLLFSCGPDPEEKKVFPKATHLYFSDYPEKRVGVMDINVTDQFDVVADNSDGLDTISGIAVDFIGGKVYAVEELNNRIVRFNIDGTGSFEVLYDAEDSVNFPTSIAVHPASNTLYWANSGTGQIKKGSMTGGTASSINFGIDTVVTYCYGLVVDSKNKLIIFSDLARNAGIWYAKTDGTKIDGLNTVLPLFSRASSSGTVLRNPSSIFLDEENKRIYWADEGLNAISVGIYVQYTDTQLAGSSSGLVFDHEDNLDRPDAIAVDNGNEKIYWSETGVSGHKIVRGNLDGTGDLETILEDVESYGMVLKFEDKD